LELDRVADRYTPGGAMMAPDIGLNDSLYQALSVMLTHNCGLLAVVDNSGQPVGSLTRDAVLSAPVAP